jgi:hypothetical protein
VRIEHAQHAGNGAVIDRLVRVHRFGIVLLDYVVDFGEGLHAVLHVGIAGGCRIADALSEQRSQSTTGENDGKNQN